MKHFKFLSAVLATVILSASVFSGCSSCSGNNGGNEGGNENTVVNPIGTISESSPHYYEGGLHRISVTDSGKKFVNEGNTEYKVISEAGDLSTAALISKHVKESSGASLLTTVSNGLTWSANQKWIVVGCAELFNQAGLTMPEEDLGWSGFHIKTKDNTVFIMAKTQYGLSNGVYSFLNYTVGFETFGKDCTTYNYETTVPLYDFDVTDKSDIDLAIPLNKIDGQTTRELSILSTADVFIPTDGTFWHNTFRYLPTNTYFESHRKWYSDGDDWENPNKPGQPAQLCYTAHGDPDEYKAMQNAFFEKLVEYIELYKTRTTITITIEDNAKFCGCEACLSAKETYGTDSAVVIHFVNDISDKLDVYLTEQAEKNGTAKRDLNLLFFAYRKTINAPVKEVDGKYVPIDESVVCRDNVGVYIAPIDAMFTKSFYDEENANTAANIKKWSACSNKIYMWIYCANFDNYLYPFNDFGAMAETYRFCVENGAMFMYNEGAWNQNNGTAFANLKGYIGAKLSWNVNYSTADLTKRFFENYFGPAASAMRLYFDKLQTYLNYLGETYPLELPGSIYEPISQSTFWTKTMLEDYLADMDKAYDAIKAIQNKDAELYKQYRDRINLESIFPRYALITLFSAYFSESTMAEMKSQFLEDVGYLDVTHIMETLTIEKGTENW